MSTAPILSNPETVGAGKSTMFDSLARLVPDELQAAYYRVLAHTRMLSPDDEMLRILEAMGVLALLTRHTPKDIAEERERFQELLDAHQQSSDKAQQKMLGYVRELESRLADLPAEVESGLNPEQIAKMLGESLRQHFLGSGLPDTVKALQATSTATTSAQKELSTALRALSDSHGGVVAQVERANRKIEHSVESRARTLDTLLREWKADLVRIWIPMIAGASLLVGMFGGMEIQGCRDSDDAPTAATTTSPPSAPDPANPKQQSIGVPLTGSTERNHKKALAPPD
jgi:predicted secreted protein